MRNLQFVTACILMLVCAFTHISCKENLIDAEQYGEIKGIIQSDGGDIVIKGAGITTNPPTVATSSNENGRFKIADVPKGSYTVQVRKEGYKSTSVNISVREDQVSDATIFLSPDEENNPSNQMAEVEITRWNNKTSNDSVYVNVDYKIENVGEADIDDYEVYFKIETESSVYYIEEAGSKLRKGQTNFGEFEKYTNSEVANKVLLNGHWLGSNEELPDED